VTEPLGQQLGGIRGLRLMRK